MPTCGTTRSVGFVVAMALMAACAEIEPPLKELHQAQGALEAARAAGAERYATDAYEATLEALRRYDEAVEDRDYRLALNHALDAREWAQDAARQAADRRATVRAEAKDLLRDAAATRDLLAERLSAPEAARLPQADVQAARTVLADADRALQEARSALEREDDLAALNLLTGLLDGLLDAEQALGGVRSTSGR